MRTSLYEMPSGANGRVCLISEADAIPRLEVIGIRTGATITKQFKSAGNSLVVRVGDARVCISATIAKAIEVEMNQLGNAG